MADSTNGNIRFPYEAEACHQLPMPNGLTYPDQIMYQFLRLLYKNLQGHAVSREDAMQEKLKAISEWKSLKFREESGSLWVSTIKKSELAREAYLKEPSIENADKLMSVLEGMPIRHDFTATTTATTATTTKE